MRRSLIKNGWGVTKRKLNFNFQKLTSYCKQGLKFKQYQIKLICLKPLTIRHIRPQLEAV